MNFIDERKQNFSGMIMRSTLLLLVVLLLAARGEAQTATQSSISPAQNYFTDIELVDQNGKPQRFYSDLLKDKVVIINAFFTTCTSVCPPMSRNLEKVQEWLGDKMGRDVHIISLSVDHETDTPPRMKDYAQKFHARPGWFFLSGKKANIELALKKVGQHVDAKDNHTTVIIIGNLQTGLWKKAFGLAKPDDLIKVVESVLNDRLEGAK